MADAIEAASKFVEGRSRSDLDADRMLVFALVRAVEIIGEAASKLSSEGRAGLPAVPWSSIVGMRNHLIHAYFDVDLDILWNTGRCRRSASRSRRRSAGLRGGPMSDTPGNRGGRPGTDGWGASRTASVRLRAAEMRAVAAAGQIPPPLVDSPKCPRCSLVGICLPDEVRFLTGADGTPTAPRPLVPARDDALPLHVQHPGARIRKDGEVLQIVADDEVIGEARLTETSQVVLFGSVHVTTPVVQELCQRGIPLCYLSSGGWFYGITHGMSHKNVELRRRQYAAASDPAKCLTLARRFVQAKIANCRTLLRRNHPSPADDLLDDFKGDIRRAGQADRLDALLGVEGTAAHRYFAAFAEMLHPAEADTATFDLESRNRRPPRDPINALLSLAYAMVTREWTVVLFSVGFDPYLGFYHQPRYGRPALALDLMEEYRPLIADSLVLTVVNNGELRSEHFVRGLGAVSLTSAGRRKFIEAYERRMSQEITHPVFGYRISYRRVLEVQARLLARYLNDEIPEYPPFTTR